MDQGGGGGNGGIEDNDLTGNLPKKRKLDGSDGSEADVVDSNNRMENNETDHRRAEAEQCCLVLQLQLQNQSLQKRMAHLERNNYLLQKLNENLMQWNHDLRHNETLFAGSMSNISNQQLNLGRALFSLPEVVLKEILKNVSDQETMLECRLACAQWNNIILDISELSRKITFPVWHPKPFMDLDIVKKGKCKSICLKFLPLDHVDTNIFMDVISNTVEKVSFDLQNPSQQDQNFLFKLILRRCTCLQELEVKNSDNKIFRSISIAAGRNQHDSSDSDSESDLDFPNITIEVASAMKLKILTVNVQQFTKCDSDGLSRFLLKLPNLEEINLITNRQYDFGRPDEVSEKIVIGVYEYLKKFGKSLKLKKLCLCRGYPVDLNETLVLLLKKCEKHKINIYPPTMKLNKFLRLTGSLKLPFYGFEQQQKQPTFSTTINGELTFSSGSSRLRNMERLDFLNIRNLQLYFNRIIFEGELLFIQRIAGLQKLLLNGVTYQTLSAASVTEFDNALSSGLITLMELEITHDIFDSFRVFWWSKYFPNLKKLRIAHCKFTSNDLIWQLSTLKSLTDIALESLDNVDDSAFTLPFAPRFAIDHDHDLDASLMIPAIGCFKSLENLTVNFCKKLTDNCVIDGIAKCKTLKKLNIVNCKGITDKSHEFVSCELQVIQVL